MSQHTIRFTVNGSVETLVVPAQMTLLTMLRERLALTGTKNGCTAGECGACTVLKDGEPVNACMVLAAECDGAEIVTVEGLVWGPLQEALVKHNAVQCGFCTPGVVVSATALLRRNPDPSDADLREALVGNLCRCTGYLRILDAVKEASRC